MDKSLTYAHLAPGCRRILIDYGYLKALHRPNVTLTWDAIDRVVPDGIIKKSGEMVPLDVIVFATGFDAVRTLFSTHV